VRELHKEALVRAGHNVLIARNGEEAFNLAERCNFNIDLVVSDLLMPRMDGSKFLEILRFLCPEVKILVVSGLRSNAVSAADALNFMQKPVPVSKLQSRVAGMLS
jgi:two-component system cell cycle sensor histidine kinase/response regulator CckA